MRYFSIILMSLTSLLLYQCNLSEKTQCLQDNEFMLNYQNCLLVLTKARHGFPTDFEDRLRAIECLEAITKKESNIIKHSDVPYLLYKQNEDSVEEDLFSYDLNNWVTWLSENKCDFNMKDAEMAFLERGQKLGTNLIWPIPFYEKLSDF